MKTRNYLIVAVLFLLIALFGYGYIKSTPGVDDLTGPIPEIVITPKYFDFGDIKYGDVVQHTFIVKNIGDAVLEIKRIATSCGCTTAKVDNDNILPGEETNLIVTYTTGAMSGDHALGEQERIIYIKNNDPINPQTEVMIYARVN